MTEAGGELLYLDSSALVKLVLAEAESGALLKSLGAWPDRVSSELARVEVVRATRRVSAGSDIKERAEQVLASLHLLKIDSDILEWAARLGPPTLRSLDAIHLASALSLGDDLGAMAVYDSGLAAAAVAVGIKVLSPGPLA